MTTLETDLACHLVLFYLFYSIYSTVKGRMAQHTTSGQGHSDLDSRLQLLNLGSLPSPEMMLTMTLLNLEYASSFHI